VFNALMLGALGVGASQALAASASPAVSYGCRTWQQTACTDWCRSMNGGNPNVVGECTSFGGSSYYDCVCALVRDDGIDDPA
jgi:hypothetical protein